MMYVCLKFWYEFDKKTSSESTYLNQLQRVAIPLHLNKYLCNWESETSNKSVVLTKLGSPSDSGDPEILEVFSKPKV